jgi:hypothetical protein
VILENGVPTDKAPKSQAVATMGGLIEGFDTAELLAEHRDLRPKGSGLQRLPGSRGRERKLRA